MQTVIPDVTIARAGVARIGIGRLDVGPIAVGQLIASDVALELRSGRAELADVRVTVRLRFSLLWSLRVPLPWPFDDIVLAEREDALGSMRLPTFRFGDAEIPQLRDIDLRIPELRAPGIVVAADPVTGLEVTGVQAQEIHVADLTLPTAGFSLGGGLGLTALNVNDVSVPAAGAGSVAIREVEGAPVRLPAASLRDLVLPAASAGNVGSGPIDLSIDRSDPFDTPSVPLPFIRVALRVRASARTQVAQMRLTGLQAGASVGSVEVRDVTVPFRAGELTLSDLGLDVLEIPMVEVA